MRGGEEVEIDVRDAGDHMDEHHGGYIAEDDARLAGRSRGHGKEHGIGDKHRERKPHRQRDRIRLQSGRQRGREDGEGRADEDGGDWRCEEHESRSETQQNISPAFERQGERVNVAPAVVGRPRRDRHQQAECGREQRIQGPPRLHRPQQLLRLEGASISARGSLQRQERYRKRRDRSQQDDDSRPLPLAIEDGAGHGDHRRVPPFRKLRNSSTNPSSRSRSITSRTDAPTPSKYDVIPGSQSPTTQFSPAPPPFPDSRARTRNGGLTTSLGAPRTMSRLVPCLSFSIGASVTNRPSSMTATQSHTRSSSCTRWLEIKIVAPRSDT